MVKEWRVSDEFSGSDHRQILGWIIEVQVKIENFRNPKRTNWQGHRKVLEGTNQVSALMFQQQLVTWSLGEDARPGAY